MDQTLEQWENGFENEEKEFLILTGENGSGGAAILNTFSIASFNLIGFIDLISNRFYKAKSIVWPITREEYRSSEFFNRFRGKTIYHIKGKLRDQSKININTENNAKQIYVTYVIEEGVSNQILEQVLADYNEVITINDDILGELTLNKRFNLLETEIDWLGDEISISLDVDEDQQEWKDIIEIAKNFVTEKQKWDEDMKKFAAQHLLELANEWAEDGNEEQDDESNVDSNEITEDIFISKLSLSSLNFEPNDDDDDNDTDYFITAYFNDGDMFWGHSIDVSLTLKKGLQSASLAG